ncbi:agip12 [Agrotis ipsilon multiple nucleopolyhedrovirus]|uniref:Envelope fusion protein n=1 Tax=Agrotis ipsilon multiple nucleopolyhedrovirus TaxID=208013 RepID=B6D5S6_9ABAC|nr:agip12 [Agrotis ipsilon multiple nucleopolyhedrovirus]ACI28714.1 envelope fusion protein [Agrotis ipsilon multiple nucleopolyhedrovirus]
MVCFKVFVFAVLSVIVVAEPLPPTTSTKTASDIVQVTELPKTSGLYFQYINKMQFVQNIWHFVIEMDHGAVFYKLKEIHQSVKRLRSYVTSLINDPEKRYNSCLHLDTILLGTNDILNNSIMRLARQHNELDQKVPISPSNAKLDKAQLEDDSSKRKKRALDFVGHVYKYLFGIMDSDDAHELHQLANSSNSLDSQVKQLTDEMIVLTNYMERKEKNEKLLYNMQSCEYAAAEYSLLCTELDDLSTLYDRLDRAVDNAKLNHLNSMVITPQRLLHEMKNVSGNLAGLSWPVPLTEKAMHVLIDNVINVHVFVKPTRKLVFIIEVPLVNSEAFDVFHSIPLPYCDESNKCAILLPDSKYLGVSVDRRSYLRMDDTTNCRMADNIMLCFRPQIIYEVNQAKLCDIRIFMKNHKDIDYDKDCDVRVGRFEDELFYATSDYNNWLYVLQENVDLNFQCMPSPTIPSGFNIKPIVLKAGVGIIHATGHDTCKLTTKKSRLSVHELYNNLNTVIEVPIETLYNFSVALKDIQNLELDSMKTNNDLEHTNLHELTNRLYELRRRMNNNTRYSGSEIMDDNSSIFSGLSDWFSSIGIEFHYIKTIVIWVILALLTLAVVKVYRNCCSGSISALFSCCRRGNGDPTVVRRDDRDMYYQSTLPRRRGNKKRIVINDDNDDDDDIEMQSLKY